MKGRNESEMFNANIFAQNTINFYGREKGNRGVQAEPEWQLVRHLAVITSINSKGKADI